MGSARRESPPRWFTVSRRFAMGAWFAALIAFAVWTREPMVREGLWRDEAISVYVASAPSVSELLSRNQVADYNPPLFNLLLAGYLRVAGSGEIALKLFALSLGLLALAGAGALAGEIGGPVAGALAGGLCVNNPLLIEMSTELRVYSLSAFLAAASLLAALWLRRQVQGASPGAFVSMAVLLTLLVYSHLAGGIVVAVLCGWGLLAWRNEPSNPFGKGLALSAFSAGLAFLPWLPTALRQFSTGIPWDEPLSLSKNIVSLLSRSGFVAPIPEGFRQPLLLVGLSLLSVVAVGQAARAVASLPQRSAGLAVTMAAGAAVWLALGLFSRHPRYLTIPTVLACVLCAASMGLLLEAAREAGPGWGSAALAASVAILAVAFSARADFYRERFSAEDRPKSGVRSLCRAREFGPGELVLAAPDYLAPTIWYYCAGRASLRGFARWENPALFDPRGYAELWSDSRAVTRTVSRLGEALRETRQSRFELVFDETAVEPPLRYGRRVRELRMALAMLYDEGHRDWFPGRLESAEAATLGRRDPTSSTTRQPEYNPLP